MEQVLGRSSEDVLKEPKQGGRNLSTAERESIDLSGEIKGWGSDLDWSVRPGVPRDKKPGIGPETLYLDVEQQQPKFKIFKSTEHARLTPVFGTSCPPRGLSGMIRDVAFNFSEGRLSHWILLMTADRVDMVEGVLLDLAKLRIPNVVKEMGLASELRHNKKGLVKALALGAGGILAVAAFKRFSAARAT